MKVCKKCDLCGSTYDEIPTLTPVRGTPIIGHVWPCYQDDSEEYVLVRDDINVSGGS